MAWISKISPIEENRLLILTLSKNHHQKTKSLSRFTAFQGEMVKKTVGKTKFSQLNDK